MALTLSASTFTHLLEQMGPGAPQILVTIESLLSILHVLDPGALGHPMLAPCLASLQSLTQSLFHSSPPTIKAHSLALQISLAVAASTADILLQATNLLLRCHMQEPPIDVSTSIGLLGGRLAAKGLHLSFQLSLCKSYKFRYSAVPHEV